VNPLIEQLDAVAASYKASRRRSSVRISVQPFFASELFVPRLAEFTAGHPEIDIQVGTSDESSEKHPANADLSIRLFQSPPSDMPADLLFPLRTVPAGSPEFSRTVKVRNKTIVSDFPIIVHETRPRAWERWANESGIGLPEDGKVIRLESMIAAARAAERGIGAALVPVPHSDRWFESGSLVRLFEQELVADVSYYLVCKKDRAQDEAVNALREWILESFVDPD
jgi:LysR family glycine cleavage system transcriptional activator